MFVTKRISKWKRHQKEIMLAFNDVGILLAFISASAKKVKISGKQLKTSQN